MREGEAHGGWEKGDRDVEEIGKEGERGSPVIELYLEESQ